jgi:deoxycytidylate deaminase
MKLEKAELDIAMNIAKRQAGYSPDEFKQVGCVALDGDGVLIAQGFNNMGQKPDDPIKLDREARRDLVIHAEIAMSRTLLPSEAVTVVATLFPCVHCMTLLASYGVKTLYYEEIYDKDIPAKRVAEFHGITCIQYTR